jgi:hypothetical protein
MRFAMGQRRSAHGVWRATRHCSGGVNNSRNSIGTLTSTQKLQYNKIIAGIGYKTTREKSSKTTSIKSTRTMTTTV